MKTSLPATAGFHLRRLRQGRRESPFVVYVPEGYGSSTAAWPLVVFLHGRGEEGTDGWQPVAVGMGPALMLEPHRWPCLALFPQKPRDRLGWTEHEWRILEPLAQVREAYRVDPARVLLTGVSLGGYGCWMLPPRHPELFAAIAPVCGGGRPDDAAALADLPIWAFHGEADAVVPASQSRRMVEAVEAAGGSPRLTLYPGVGHNSWDRAYREERLAEWLLGEG